MYKSIKTIIALTVFFASGLLASGGCNKNTTSSHKVSGFFVSDCNDVPHIDDMRDIDYPYYDTIYVTAIGETKMKISTTNTRFDCCAESFGQEIDTQGQNISVVLTHKGSACDCECGHHVDLTIDNIEIGQTYIVNIKKDDYDYHQFEVAFEPDTNLMFIIGL